MQYKYVGLRFKNFGNDGPITNGLQFKAFGDDVPITNVTSIPI